MSTFDADNQRENIEIDLESVTRALTQQVADLSLKCAMQEGAIQKLRQKLSESQKAIDAMSAQVGKEGKVHAGNE